MAGRHYFPTISESDIGPDASRTLPMFSNLEPFKYKAGMDPAVLARGVAGKERVALEAPPCSRKSVDVPAALLRGGVGSLVVHCVPSRLLAADLRDYVATIHKDIVVHGVFDFDGAHVFPDSGLVFTSSSVLTAYMSSWRAHGVAPEFVLFLDEMHESDFATAVLRRAQTVAPGVKVYVEATATRGTGNGGFGRPTLPGSLTERVFPRTKPRDWNLYEKGKPWSILKTTGDFLVFEDDPDEATMICMKFADHGFRAFRLHARMDVEDFRRTMAQLRKPPPGEGVAVIVADYSFRSGFTFNTVTRLIDQAEVRYMQVYHGRQTWEKRNAHMFEVHQTKARVGRVEGQACDYWTAECDPKAVNVQLEGIEVDLACLMYRMLGFKPDHILSFSPFYSGKVPRQFNLIMPGSQALRVYKSESDWPGEDRAPRSPEPVSPIDPQFPVTPGSVDGDRESVFTLDDNASDRPGSITEERFNTARVRASRVRAREKPRLEDAPAIPRIDEGSFGAFDDAFSRLTTAETTSLEYGKYYYAVGVDPQAVRVYREFADVLKDMCGVDPYVFVNPLRGHVLHDVVATALTAYNDSVVVMTAANYVMQYAAGSETVQSMAEPRGLRQWSVDIRGEYMRAQATAKVAMGILSVAKAFHFVPIGDMREREQYAAEDFLSRLSVFMHDPALEVAYKESLPDPGFDPSGRYQIDLQPDGWRAKLALAVLGRKPGAINLAITPEGETAQVYTTARDVSRATVKRF